MNNFTQAASQLLSANGDSLVNMQAVNHYLYAIFVKLGLGASYAALLNTIALALILGMGITLLLIVFKWLIHAIFSRINRHQGHPLINHLLRVKFPRAIAQIFPYILLKIAIPVVFLQYPHWVKLLDTLADVYIVIILCNSILSIVKALFEMLSEKPLFQGKPVKSYIQIIAIIVWILAAVVIFSVVTGLSPAKFFAAMGAASAILMLMFKDSIMGFVASIQVTTNDMVRIGDWITMSKYDIDGDVIDIALTTVKVQNFDKTITTIPTYTLISDSFQNWRGMQNYGGRRIKRSLLIKQHSIRYIAESELAHFRQIQGIADYIDRIQAEITAHNNATKADHSLPINGHNLTNAGLFRHYVEWYLKHHPGINAQMTLMVRQLPPSAIGIPFELYAFTNTVNWGAYEEIMADIFEHLIASVGYFDLVLFENRTDVPIRPNN
jgi:miniconductance mechanosensitive channel